MKPTEAGSSLDKCLHVVVIEDKPEDIIPKDLQTRLRDDGLNPLIAGSPEAVVKCIERMKAGKLPKPDIISSDLDIENPSPNAPFFFKDDPARTGVTPAATVQAAGLWCGILMAASFPGRPIVLVPYSGKDYFDKVWALVQLFAPKLSGTLSLVSGVSANKSRNKEAVLQAAVNVYREQSLKKAMEYGAVVVPTSELSRLLRAPAFQKDETVLFSVGRDARRIYLRSLFYREDLYDSPTSWNKLEQQARLWLNDVRQLRSPAEEKAQTLAWFFWLKSRSAESRLRYRERRASEDLVLPWLLGRHWTQEHAVRRLAVFFLMLIELGFRAFALRASEEAIKMPGEFSYDKYRRFLDRVREIVELLQEATLSEEQKDNVDNVRQFLETASLDHDIKELESVAGPLTDIDVIRLVDPLPDLSDIIITLNKAERIGNALDNLDLDIPGLLEGYDRCVTDHTERVHLVRFARELITDGFFQSTEEWPPWLVRVDARLSGG